jgi:hypothetical protein
MHAGVICKRIVRHRINFGSLWWYTMPCKVNLRAWLVNFLRRYQGYKHLWKPKFECKFVVALSVHKSKISLLWLKFVLFAVSSVALVAMKLWAMNFSSVPASWTTLTASFSTFHSPAEDRRRRLALRAGRRTRSGPNFAQGCYKITAILKTGPFSFRRGRTMSPLHSHNLPPAVPPGPRASVTTVYVIGWMMTILRFQLHLLHVLQLIRVPGQLEDATAARRAEAVVKGPFFH